MYTFYTDECEIPYTAVGCYREPAAERALTELILDDVDPTSSTFMGIVSTDFKDWNEYFTGLICRCARKIKEKGYRTFGINNKGTAYCSKGITITITDLIIHCMDIATNLTRIIARINEHLKTQNQENLKCNGCHLLRLIYNLMQPGAWTIKVHVFSE